MQFRRHLAFAAASLTFPFLVWADETPAATPYRPTLSNPAELPAPGWLEIEAGWQRTRGNDLRRNSLPYTAKLAFDENWGVLVGGEAHIREATPDGTLKGFGDTSITLKHRFATSDEDLNFGIEAGAKSPTAKTGLGSGKTDWTINGIASLDFAEDWRLDANLGFTRLGAVAPGESRNATLLAAALAKQISAWGLAIERSDSRQSGTPSARQWLAAVSYATTPQFVVDLAVARTRQGEERQHTLMLGFTWLSAKLF